MSLIQLVVCLLLACMLSHQQQIFMVYSQGDQQLIYRRFFQGVQGGYYADIGAYDPFYISTTANLAAQGWQGVNVQANPNRVNRFFSQRSNAVNLFTAVGQEDKYVTLIQALDDSSSSINPNYHKFLKEGGRYDFGTTGTVNVPSMSLMQICQRFFAQKPLAMNLDVQGLQATAFKGNNWNNQKCRPDVIIFQVFGKQQAIHNGTRYGLEPAENILIENGYKRFKLASQGANLVFINQKRYDFYQKKYVESKNNQKYLMVNSFNIYPLIYKHLKIKFTPVSHYYPERSQVYHHYHIIRQPLMPEALRRKSNKSINKQIKNNRPIVVYHFDPRKSSILIENDSFQKFDVQIYCQQIKRNVHFWHFELKSHIDQQKYSVYIMDHQIDPSLQLRIMSPLQNSHKNQNKLNSGGNIRKSMTFQQAQIISKKIIKQQKERQANLVGQQNQLRLSQNK